MSILDQVKAWVLYLKPVMSHVLAMYVGYHLHKYGY